MFSSNRKGSQGKPGFSLNMVIKDNRCFHRIGKVLKENPGFP